jgi:hypothetical protein
MITYLHHTDPVIPHYREGEWNYQRGAAATVDRPILGWQGRFFLHDVAHFHVIHHVSEFVRVESSVFHKPYDPVLPQDAILSYSRGNEVLERIPWGSLRER